ncbi:MAG: hypothetical protein ACRDJW_11130 [Thermomicrobiales bacterium]
MRHSVDVVRAQDGSGWVVRTTSYSYWMYDADGTELVTYQWEPAGRSPVKTPHVHIGKALASGDVPEHIRRRFSRLASAHLPTGLITVTDILRTAIRDFGVEPLRRVPGDSSTIDWDGIERLFRAADAALRASFENAGGHEQL